MTHCAVISLASTHATWHISHTSTHTTWHIVQWSVTQHIQQEQHDTLCSDQSHINTYNMTHCAVISHTTTHATRTTWHIVQWSVTHQHIQHDTLCSDQSCRCIFIRTNRWLTWLSFFCVCVCVCSFFSFLKVQFVFSWCAWFCFIGKVSMAAPQKSSLNDLIFYSFVCQFDCMSADYSVTAPDSNVTVCCDWQYMLTSQKSV